MNPKKERYKVTLEFRQKESFIVDAISPEDAEDQAIQMIAVSFNAIHHDTIIEKL